MEFKIKRARPGDCPAPRYARPGDAGMDFCADIRSPIIVWPFQIVNVPLGWSVEIPSGHVGLLRPRSGHASRGLLMSSSGVIDSGYRGEVMYNAVNTRLWPKIIRPGERICQMLILPFVRTNVSIVSHLGDTERGAGGYGHTGS